jgi:hypothetical protein
MRTYLLHKLLFSNQTFASERKAELRVAREQHASSILWLSSIALAVGNTVVLLPVLGMVDEPSIFQP